MADHGDALLVARPMTKLTPEWNKTSVAKWLMDAIERNDDAAALRLIAEGADPGYADKRGLSPLCSAIYRHRTEVAVALIAAGANVNYQNFKKGVGLTPLMRACFNGSDKIVQALLDKGADVNLQDNRGRTALMDASHFDALCLKPRMVDRLLREKPDVNKRTIGGSTALMMNSSQPENVKHLMKAGADIQEKNEDGNTAYDLVRGTINHRTAGIYKRVYDNWARAADRKYQRRIETASKAMTDGTKRNIRPLRPLQLKAPKA